MPWYAALLRKGFPVILDRQYLQLELNDHQVARKMNAIPGRKCPRKVPIFLGCFQWSVHMNTDGLYGQGFGLLCLLRPRALVVLEGIIE